MSDLHDRLADWLGAGAPGEPARDVALHASACQTCLGRIAALDALADIDLGGAPIPPTAAGQAVSSAILVRALIGTTAVAVLTVGIVAGSGLMPPRVPADGATASTTPPTPGGGVLAGEGAPSTPSPTTDNPDASAAPTRAAPSAEATPGPVGGGSGPVAGGPVPAGTPPPRATPSNEPPVTPPPPTPSPRGLPPPPIPTPTAQPTPTPIVPPPNAPPVALADDYSVAPGQALVVDAAAGLLANDTDPDGDVLTAFADPVAGLTLNADGSFTFEAPADFTGITFSYLASDGVASSSPATVTIAAAP